MEGEGDVRWCSGDPLPPAFLPTSEVQKVGISFWSTDLRDRVEVN